MLTTAAMAPNLPDGLTLLELDGTGWVEQLRADPGLPVYTKPALTPKTPAYLTMTSGSTGKPKAVVNDHLGAVVYVTFWPNFHHVNRIELGLRGHTHVRGAASSCLRLKWADMVLL